MEIRHTVSALSKSLPQYTKSYAQTRATTPELAPYATVHDLEKSLNPKSPVNDKTRQTLALTLVQLAKQTRNPLWQSLLLIAHEQLLHRIARPWRRIDDAPERAIYGFIEALHRVDVANPPPRLAMYLLGTASRLGFNDLRATKSAPESLEFDENTYAAPNEGATTAAVDLHEFIEGIEDTDQDEVLRALIATKTNGESLRRFVDREYYEHDDATRNQAYRRLRASLKAIRERADERNQAARPQKEEAHHAAA